MSRIVFLSCHLSGTGHLVRTLLVARAALGRGHEVTVITGGRRLGHLDMAGLAVVQLPPVHIEGFEFGVLRDNDGVEVDARYMAARSEAIAAALAAARPDALVTELFPLGRRVLSDEFLGAIAVAKEVNPRVAVVSSVRDIPEPKPRRLSETAARLIRHYHGVLVHGDEQFLPLATTWPLPDDVAPMIHHVGYIGTAIGADVPPGEEVLVSVGGGVLGRELLDVAARAAALSDRSWRLIVGGADGAGVAAEIAATHATPGLTVEGVRPDFRDLLAGAACSVSLCGYNTAVELAACTTPAILVPSEEADEQEQLIRARKLAEQPGIVLMRTETLSPEGLAAAAEGLASGPRRPPISIEIDDGTRAVAVVEALIAGRSA